MNKRTHMSDWGFFVGGAGCRSWPDTTSGRGPAKKSTSARGVRIGFSQSGQVLRYPGAGHPDHRRADARMGKGRDIPEPALLEWDQSCIVIDPKGELAAVTGHYRKRFGDVLVLNPFDIWRKHLTGTHPRRDYNPSCKPGPEQPVFLARMPTRSADAIVWHE